MFRKKKPVGTKLLLNKPASKTPDSNDNLGTLSRLPQELIMGIFAYVPTKDLCRSRSVSKAWNEMSRDPVLWHNRCMQQYGPSVWKPDARSWEWVCRAKDIDIGQLPANVTQVVGHFTATDGTYTEGDFENGKLNGLGYKKLVVSEYWGEFEKNEPHGTGCAHYANGDFYEGTCAEGQLTGHGKYKWKIGDFYQGHFVNNEGHGKGTLRFANGDRYEGEFVNNRISGYGTFYWHNQSYYRGDWIADSQSGLGYLDYGDGRVYDGRWKDNNHHGKGIYTWPDGTTYSGEWSYGKRHGYGHMKLADGTFYSGEWSDDMPTFAPTRLPLEGFFHQNSHEQSNYIRRHYGKRPAENMEHSVTKQQRR